MAVRPTKWHIYNNSKERYPLCWDDKALEFDFEIDAQEFIDSIKNCYLCEDMLNSICFMEVVFDILYYDGGYLNATDLRCSTDPETAENILVKKDLL